MTDQRPTDERLAYAQRHASGSARAYVHLDMRIDVNSPVTSATANGCQLGENPDTTRPVYCGPPSDINATHKRLLVAPLRCRQ